MAIYMPPVIYPIVKTPVLFGWAFCYGTIIKEGPLEKRPVTQLLKLLVIMKINTFVQTLHSHHTLLLTYYCNAN